MRYAKPEVVALASAAQAIQGSQKNSPFHVETVYPYKPTLMAYEADE